MKLSIANKLSIVLTALILISVGITSWLFYDRTIELLVDEAIDDTSRQMRVTGDTWKEEVAIQKSDVLYLASLKPVLKMATISNDESIKNSDSISQLQEQLEPIFKTMLETKSSYKKITVVNNKGQVLAFAKKGNAVFSVDGNKSLYDYQDESYVKKVLSLPQGQVYLSEVSLKRENGVVIEPHQEVLRVGTPIYDVESDKLTGLIVITVDIGKVLHGIQRMVEHSGKGLFITNDMGGYLLHKDKFKSYGFDLGKRFRVQEDIPEVAALYLPDNTQSQAVLRLEQDHEQKIVNFTKIFFDESHPERFIAIGITEPYSRVLAEEQALLKGVVLASIVLTIIAVFVAILVSYKISRPINKITAVLDGYINDRDINIDMPVKSKDEIGVMARSFETLIAQVKDAQHGLTVMNKNLELRVIERTNKLEFSERRQRSIVDNIADGLVTMNECGIIESFNKAATTIFGYQQEEVIGNNIKMLMPEHHKSRHDGYLEKYHRTGIKKVIGSINEVEAVAKDGRSIPIELSVSEIIIDDKKMYTGVLRDISERKQVEKLKSEFVSTVSHELRTPLTSIRGVLGLIVGGAIGKIPDEMKDMLAVAENNAKRLLLLINDILDIQKIQNNDIQFQFEELKINALVEEAIADNKNLIEEFNVAFDFDKAVSDAYVQGDRYRLMQVLTNLLSNAAKFSPPNSVVNIRTCRRDRYICIDVADRGPGIPEGFEEKIFEKFTQSDSSGTRRQGGTGLGLSISRSIVERHHGDLTFAPNDGNGTVFTLQLEEATRQTNKVIDISSR